LVGWSIRKKEKEEIKLGGWWLEGGREGPGIGAGDGEAEDGEGGVAEGGGHVGHGLLLHFCLFSTTTTAGDSGLPLRGLCSRSVCEESSEGGWEAEGRGFYSPRARRQVGLGLVLGSHACACLCLRLRTEPGEGRAPGPLELETCASRPARQDFSLAVVCLRLQGGSGGGAIGRCHMRVSVCVSFLWGQGKGAS
jgi:hypothetical protein